MDSSEADDETTDYPNIMDTSSEADDEADDETTRLPPPIYIEVISFCIKHALVHQQLMKQQIILM